MKKNITVTMGDRQISSAKLYAKKQGESLSSLVEELLKEYTRENQQ